MIPSRWKKVWSDLWGNKSRTFLIIATIAVGTFAVGFNSNMGLYMNESMDGDYLSANPSEANVYAYPINEDMLDMARAIPGVEQVEAYSTTSARIVRPDGTLVNIQFTALEDPDKRLINYLKPRQGETIMPTYGDRETIIDASAAALGLEPGDVIVVELDDGKHRELT